jgi:hypothetical protein
VTLGSAFLPVRVTPEANGMSGARAKSAFEVVLRGGRVLRVPEDFDAATLGRLLAALEEDR